MSVRAPSTQGGCDAITTQTSWTSWCVRTRLIQRVQTKNASHLQHRQSELKSPKGSLFMDHPTTCLNIWHPLNRVISNLRYQEIILNWNRNLMGWRKISMSQLRDNFFLQIIGKYPIAYFQHISALCTAYFQTNFPKSISWGLHTPLNLDIALPGGGNHLKGLL